MNKKRYKKAKLFLALFLTLVMISGMTAFAAGHELSDSTLQNENRMVTSSESVKDSNEEHGKTEAEQVQENTDSTRENEATTEKENSEDSATGDAGDTENKEDSGEELTNGKGTSSNSSHTEEKNSSDTSEDVEKDSTSKAKDENIDTKNEKVVSVMQADEIEEKTAISSNEEEGIAQLKSFIPDLNFRTEVWRSLSAVGQLGDPDDPEYKGLEGEDLYSAVLRNFTGDIYANGYVKKYHYTVYGTIGGLLTSLDANSLEELEEAINKMESYGAEITHIDQKLVVTDQKKPDDQLITNISGIEYLRKANKIDLSHNRITSLMPLDRVELLDKYYKDDSVFFDAFVYLEKEGIVAARKLFGDTARNTELDLYDNPITIFPQYLPGRLMIKQSRTPAFVSSPPVIVTVKHPDEDISVKASIDAPQIKIGGKSVSIRGDNVFLNEQNNTLGLDSDDLYFDEDSLKCFLSGISHSGQVTVNIGTVNTGEGGDDDNTMIRYAYADDGGVLTTGGFGVTARLNQQVRVLYEVLPGEPGGKVEVDFQKVDMETKESVKGAKYRLFRMKMNGDTTVYEENDTVTISKDEKAVNQDGTVIAEPVMKGEGSSQQYIEYTTDEKGGFHCEEDLGSGTYCFIETSSPNGYELNTKPLIFTVAGTETVTISGGTNLTKVKFSNVPKDSTYRLYKEEKSGDQIIWKLYNNDDELGFSSKDGVIQIDGLEDGKYQLRENSSGTGTIEFTITEGKAEINSNSSASGISVTGRGVSYIDRYSEDIDIILPEMKDDMKLDSLTVSYYDQNNAEKQQVFSSGSAEEIVNAAKNFINTNKGTAEKMGKIQGQVTITPVYKYTKEEPLKAEDPKKVEFSFTKTDGDPSDEKYIGLAGATFTLYHAHKDANGNWEYSETTDKYKEATAASDGKVNFEYIDSGDYIMKETTPPQGYATLPGYWKITADAWTQEKENKLTFLYVGKNGDEKPVSEDNLMDMDEYGNQYYIPNYTVEELLSMGGRGTRLFKVFGLFFTGVAVILFAYARRNKKKEY